MTKRFETTISKQTIGLRAVSNGKSVATGTLEQILTSLLRANTQLYYKDKRVISFEKEGAWVGVDTFAKMSALRLTIDAGCVRIAVIKDEQENDDDDTN